MKTNETCYNCEVSTPAPSPASTSTVAPPVEQGLPITVFDINFELTEFLSVVLVVGGCTAVHGGCTGYGTRRVEALRTDGGG